MMPVSHVQSCVCHVTVLADAGSLPQSESTRMLTAVDLTANGVTVNKRFLKVTYSQIIVRMTIWSKFASKEKSGESPNVLIILWGQDSQQISWWSGQKDWWSCHIKSSLKFDGKHSGCSTALLQLINTFTIISLKSNLSCHNCKHLQYSSFFSQFMSLHLLSPLPTLPTSPLTAVIVYLIKLIKTLMPACERVKEVVQGCSSAIKLHR